MTKNRLEAFSDGVLAIIITIMVLELKVPHTADPAALRELAPVLAGYVVSFLYVGIYWNNHHHLLHTAEKVSGGILWANLHLLFWLSLMPFVTTWSVETGFAALPVAAYGGVLLAAGTAYFILTKAIVARHGPDSTLAKAIGRDWKGKASVAAYLAAIPLAFWCPWVAIAVYVAVAILWIVPDRRIEKVLDPHEHDRPH